MRQRKNLDHVSMSIRGVKVQLTVASDEEFDAQTGPAGRLHCGRALTPGRGECDDTVVHACIRPLGLREIQAAVVGDELMQVEVRSHKVETRAFEPLEAGICEEEGWKKKVLKIPKRCKMG